jgi:hypothetical protein
MVVSRRCRVISRTRMATGMDMTTLMIVTGRASFSVVRMVS